ncbi:MAG: cobalamin biosynthesis protein, partial [Deltaproteobacteria bacterium]|nr:cobalamin biosynthesis protein [Deltaproteobacteria bacterium]
ARQIASITGGHPVITTATDTAGIISVDLLAKERNMAIGDIEAVKAVNGAMLAGEVAQVFDPEDRLGLVGQECHGEIMAVMVKSLEQWQPSVPGIRVSWEKAKYEPSILVLHPRCLVAGIGCNRNTPAEEILDAIKEVFHQNNLALASQVLKTELLFFNKEALGAILAPNPSERVKFHVGVDSVCEAAAILAAGKGSLIVPKTKTKNVTVAVALAP